MSVSIDEIVRRTIRHADRMAAAGGHDWPNARSALTKILLDLEKRAPGDPSLNCLRDYLAQRERDFLRGKGAK